jgi:hypothetical protein
MPRRIRQITIAARSGRTYLAHAILNFKNTFKRSAHYGHAARKAALRARLYWSIDRRILLWRTGHSRITAWGSGQTVTAAATLGGTPTCCTAPWLGLTLRFRGFDRAHKDTRTQLPQRGSRHLMSEYDSRNTHIMALTNRVRARTVMFRAVLVFKQ